MDSDLIAIAAVAGAVIFLTDNPISEAAGDIVRPISAIEDAFSDPTAPDSFGTFWNIVKISTLGGPGMWNLVTGEWL